MKQYYIIIPGKPQEGPLDEENLIKRYKSGTLPETTQVWCPGMENWLPLPQSPLAAAIKANEVETFFPKAHPHWSIILSVLAFLFYIFCLNAEDEETFNFAWVCFSPFVTLFAFYLACWFLANNDKKAIKNLFLHTLMLAIAEIMLGLPFINSNEFTLPLAIVVLLNFAAYILIPYKLFFPETQLVGCLLRALGSCRSVLHFDDDMRSKLGVSMQEKLYLNIFSL